MRYSVILPILSTISAAAFVTASPALAQLRYLSDGPQVEFRDMVARVVVTPEDRSDVDIRVRYGKVKVPTLMVSQRGNVTVLNGHLSNPDRASGFNFRINIHDDDQVSVNGGRVNISGIGMVNVSDLPLVFVRVPANAIVKDSAYTFGRVGAARNLDIVMNGGGEWAIDAVSGQLNIINSGSGTINVTSAGDSIVDNMGAGDINIGTVRNLKAVLTGSGNFAVNQAAETVLQNQGSGDVTLTRTAGLKVQLNGSGDLSLGAVMGPLTVVNNGSSDINVGRVMGPVTLDLSGSGDVSISEGQTPAFMLKGSGSGDVYYGGVTHTVNVDTNGSGDVSIMKATGAVVTKVVGSGEMHIGH
ncbi:GIN domain-containing protein [Asticcacaulis sp. 201]|uniref:GIN domain-containing protein n=1 Tax=Asticcacaulis sp. 201 TaxID=3028787 RepID=UPI002916B1C4|nr:DUF2807 domain-containing protein [Asticcacaulis sp. 201]MDV6332533.1 DUF2807 domain-containing protein [Asticcacaulis sp. 201]